MLRRHEDVENGTAWSNSSESSDDSSSPRLSVGGAYAPLRIISDSWCPCPSPDGGGDTRHPASSRWDPPLNHISFCPRDSSSTPNSTHKISPVSEDPHTSARPAPSSREEESVTVTTKADSEEEDSGKRSPIAAGGVTNSHPPSSYSRSLSHISESSADGIVLTDRAVQSGGGVSPTSGISITDIEMEVQSRTPPQTRTQRLTMPQTNRTHTPLNQWTQKHTHSQTYTQSGDVTYVARWVSVEEETPEAESPSRGSGGPVDSGLEDALTAVVSSLDDYRGQFPELQLLEQELKLLQVTLKVGRSLEMLPQGEGS
ncbi:hypothetical protein KUCAC02_021088 [Chaenocephalus aceratus]|uniref:Uncharacterized protein n=1 Tax=Chaenocephalus aceratus TaxID=36190 RepID=A0ACB9XED9_CHAAC|nr:hypothetical protein KUCAC02_021088 [Chaenocephalus aceratus]